MIFYDKTDTSKTTIGGSDDLVEIFAEMTFHEAKDVELLNEIPKPTLGEGEWAVAKRVKIKHRKRNPRTGRMKKFKQLQWIKTKISPEQRTFRNMPRYADKKVHGSFLRLVGIDEGWRQGCE